MVSRPNPVIDEIKGRIERNGSSEQGELTPEEVTARFRELARQAVEQARVDLGIGIEEHTPPGLSAVLTLASLKFASNNVLLNCSACGYRGPLLQEYAVVSRYESDKRWRCPQCRTTVQVTVQI